jgi:hypothetical protein
MISFYSLNQCPGLNSIQQRKIRIQSHILIPDHQNDICQTGERRLYERFIGVFCMEWLLTPASEKLQQIAGIQESMHRWPYDLHGVGGLVLCWRVLARGCAHFGFKISDLRVKRSEA